MEYKSYKHYLLVNKVKDSRENYENYLRVYNSGSSPEWLIKAMAKHTWNYRFITSDVMI